MTVASTSLSAYDHLRDSGKLTARQAQVLSVIQPGRDYSLQEISLLCGLPINCITGRVKELREAGRLEFGMRRKCKCTGNNCNPVQLTMVEGG